MQSVSIDAGLDGELRVVLCGEVDFANAATAGDMVREAIAERRPAAVRVDLGAVTFLDSSGIGVLVQAMKAAAAVDAAFRVEHPNGNVFDQLRMTGLLELFGMTESDG